MSHEAQMAVPGRAGKRTEPRERDRNFPERPGCEKPFLGIDSAWIVG